MEGKESPYGGGLRRFPLDVIKSQSRGPRMERPAIIQIEFSYLADKTIFIGGREVFGFQSVPGEAKKALVGANRSLRRGAQIVFVPHQAGDFFIVAADQPKIFRVASDVFRQATLGTVRANRLSFSTTKPNATAAQDRYGSARHTAWPDPHGKKEPVLKKPAKTCLILHKKSCIRPEVKAAVKHVRESGIDVDVYIPWSRKNLRRFVRQAIKDGVGG